jgi:hypothetical protein
LHEPDKAGILHDQSISFSQGAAQENHRVIWLNTQQEQQFVFGARIETILSISNVLVFAFMCVYIF